MRGFRIRDFAYLTDIKTIDSTELKKLEGLSSLVVSALHHDPHHSHFNLQEALQFIHEVKPQKAYLTHLSHRMGLHESVSKMLPPGVFVGYDGLEIPLD